ncbi:MAG: SWIM zinc finger family protein [Patescibacteria group bacterium]
MPPNYDLDKIKFATDGPTFEKAVDLYESGKVTQFDEGIGAYSAVVLGTKPYRVSAEARRYGLANCDCYLGQNDTLCKHMVAVAIYAVMGGKKLSKDDKELVSSPVCSGQLGELSKEELVATKKDISSAMKYIKAYRGPSRIWFTYQNSLDEGRARLSKLVSELPVSEQTTKLLIDLLLRLDKKLCVGGVDDSDGTVGGFVYEVVDMLKEFVKLDFLCVKAFGILTEKETCFGWEEPLVKILDEQS